MQDAPIIKSLLTSLCQREGFPSLGKRGEGRFSNQCQFNFETLNKKLFSKKMKRELKKIGFFGCPLDGDERHESIQEKLVLKGVAGVLDDPYHGIMEIIRQEVNPDLWSEKGSLDIPSWLRPIPSLADQGRMTTEAFVNFLDQGGFRTYAQRAGDFIATNIFPDIPCMLAVDHSLTGGAFKKLVELYEPENLSLIVLDTHTDAIPMSVMAGMIQYDIDN